MQPPLEIPIEQRVSAVPHEALVQDRPTIGSMPMARHGLGWGLLPVIDFACSSLALLGVTLIARVDVFPALPVAPLLLVLVYGLLGVYGARPGRGAIGAEGGAGWPVIRLLVGALFAWSAALLTSFDGGEQLALFAAFVVLDFGVRAVVAPYLQGLDPIERWVLVGDTDVAERLRAYTPLRDYATVIASVAPLEPDDSAGRARALELVEQHKADRVVISTAHADDGGLLSLVRAFKAVGVPVSMLPRPLDLLEAPAARPTRIGGVPLIEVESLAARESLPWKGADRRSERRTARVTVVVPAMNEEGNIAQVLGELPDGLHEVILVDGNSRDKTIEVAQRAYPSIRVTTQGGKGKGDALRTGFAAATGNLIVMLDADGSADPAEIPRFVEALEAGADFAKGSRFLEGGGSADITLLRKVGNAFLSGTANLLHGTRFTDLCYGYNAFWVRCLPFISLDVPGFEVETLINLRISGAGMKIAEVPSYEKERISGASNLNTFRDGVRVLGTIFREARRRRSIHREHPVAGAAAIEQARAAAPAAKR
jgi:Glycosyl transferase family 2